MASKIRRVQTTTIVSSPSRMHRFTVYYRKGQALGQVPVTIVNGPKRRIFSGPPEYRL